MRIIGFLGVQLHNLRKAFMSIFAATLALVWKAQAQNVQPLYGVPIFTVTPTPMPKYGVMPDPSITIMYGPPPLPTSVPQPTPGLTAPMFLPMLAIAIGSIIFVIVCAAVGYLWLSKRNRDKK